VGSHSNRIALLGLLVAAGLAVDGCKQPDQIESPAIGMRNLHVRQYSGGRADIEADLLVKNPNDFDVTLTRVHLDLEIDGVPLGRIEWSGQIPIAKNIESPASIPTTLQVGAHDDVFTALIDRQAVSYALAGEIGVDRGVISLDLPVEASGRLNESR
jgi:LEA14-like dessication related protein